MNSLHCTLNLDTHNLFLSFSSKANGAPVLTFSFFPSLHYVVADVSFIFMSQVKTYICPSFKSENYVHCDMAGDEEGNNNMNEVHREGTALN